eukprot:39726_1
MDGLAIAAIAWMIFNYIILCPLMIYFLYMFHRIDIDSNVAAHISGNHHQINKYRSKPITYILNLIMFIILLIERPLANAIGVWCIFNLNWLYYFTFSITWWSAFCLFSIKVFYLYYNQQYALSLADIGWQKAINPVENNANWYINNRAKYGNPRYYLKILSIPFIIAVLINTTIAFIFGENLPLDVTQYLIGSIPILFSFIIFFKSRKLDDIYKIRNETLYQCIILAIALLLYVFLFLMFGLSPQPNGKRLEWVLRNLIANLFAIGLALIPTAYPVLTHKHLQQVIRQKSETVQSITSIKEIIRDYKSFDVFIQHLILELCPETLLFLVEVIQVKYMFLDKILKSLSRNKDAIKDYIDIFYVLRDFQTETGTRKKDEIYSVFHTGQGQFIMSLHIPSCLPQSIILTQQEDIKDQMYALYLKYIVVGSDLQLNVSSSTRRNVQKMFDSDKETAGYLFLTCMDSAAMETLVLLKDAFARFRKSDLFRHLSVI